MEEWSALAKNGGNAIINNKISSPIESRKHPTGNPAGVEILGDSLNSRQKKILDKLPQYNSRETFDKRSVSMRDLAALTAYEGVEFAMFTKGGKRLIIRGERNSVDINDEEAKALSKQGYTWSGHTHPGRDHISLSPSAGDRCVLKAMEQKYSLIVSSTGRKYIFAIEKYNDIKYKK